MERLPVQAGLVGDVVPKEQLMQRARELAKIIAMISQTPPDLIEEARALLK